MAQPASVLQPAGAPAAGVADLSWLLIGGAGLIFIAVMALLWWVVRPGHCGSAAAPDAARRAGRVWIIGGGLVVPGMVLVSLLGYTLAQQARSALVGADDLVVSVTGRTWWWQVRYDGAVHTANEIHIPAGRTVVLGLNSADVIHSLWVPQLAGKVDMVPGRVQTLRVRADRPGVYRGQCAEFCGEQHAQMALHVVVDTPADFERWLARQRAPAAPPQGALAERGLALFESLRCNGCHAVRGLLDGAEAGPDLTHVASRRFIGAGVLSTDRAAFAQWLAGVQHLKPGARMPSYQRVDAASLDALAAFLEQLR